MAVWKISLHLNSQNCLDLGHLKSQWVSDFAFEVSDFSESSMSAENKLVKQLGLDSLGKICHL